MLTAIHADDIAFIRSNSDLAVVRSATRTPLCTSEMVREMHHDPRRLVRVHLFLERNENSTEIPNQQQDLVEEVYLIPGGSLR